MFQQYGIQTVSRQGIFPDIPGFLWRIGKDERKSAGDLVSNGEIEIFHLLGVKNSLKVADKYS